MTVDQIDVEASVNKVQQLLAEEAHLSSILQKADDADEIKILELDWITLPPGDYKEAGYESRQVFDIDIQSVVTEYRAEVLVGQGARWCIT